jgi:MFS family permease
MTALLRRNRDFRRLWLGSTISALGSWLLVVAVPVQVFRLTHSVVATGLTVALESVPALLVGPWAGVLADRWRRRHTMIAADLVSAVAVAALVFADRPARVGLLYGAVFAENLAVVCFRPAARAATPLVVGTGPDLAVANGLTAFAGGAVRLAAPPLGAVLLAGGGFTALVVVDVATYLLSAWATARVGTPLGPASRGPSVRLRVGLAYLVATPPLAGTLACGTLFLTLNAGLTALVVPFVVERLTGDGADFGYLVAGLGAGYLAGAPLAPRLIARLPTGALLTAAQAATGLGFLALFNSRALPVAVVAAAVVGLPGSVYLVTVAHLVQAVTANAVLGRVGAVYSAGDAGAAVAGAFLGPALATTFGLPAALNALGLATLVTAASGVLLVRRPVIAAGATAPAPDAAAG